MPPQRTFTGLLTGMLSAIVAGCALLTPLPDKTTIAQRLAAIPVGGAPVRGRVTIYWNVNQIPFIEAQHDADAAFALGLVHAHLRLGQMEIFRRISQGRLAEMGGPIATDIDHGLRVLNFGRAVAEIERTLPATSREWLTAYVRGINHYQNNISALPLEYAVLGLKREPWTVRDVLTFGRLAGSDVNWLVWFNALRLRKREDWPRIWKRLVRNGGASVPSFDGDRSQALWNELLAGVSKSGSNSLAIAPSRSRTGAAIMASDPHLGITLPNLWLIVGLKSPSYHVVGLTAPGLPVFAIGRNPWIAWGGTNMRAASSDLFDASDLGPGDFTERTERIAVRWWFDREVTLRDTKWGPVLSDAPMLGDAAATPFVLRWTGHSPSDEIGAMLAASRSRDFRQFRESFDSFAVPGQNMLYADAAGNIGQVMAVRLPARNGTPPADIVLDRKSKEETWRRMVGVKDLPFSLNPDSGYLVSANNRPTKTGVPVGYFFSPDDRVVRVNRIFEEKPKLGIVDVERVQQDVYMPSSVTLRDLYVEKLAPLLAGASEAERGAVDLMRQWDGYYKADSRGAVAFELFHAAFSHAFYAGRFGEEDGARFGGLGGVKALLAEDIAAARPDRLAEPLAAGLAALAENVGNFSGWGDMHRLRIAHPLSNLPLIGGRYVFAEYPTGGSSDTLMKTAHATTESRHNVRYGSNARHISDMSDMDRNYFVLLGGQDGWINSANFIDQVAAWREGSYITVPLRLESVRAQFPHRTVLEPAAGG